VSMTKQEAVQKTVEIVRRHPVFGIKMMGWMMKNEEAVGELLGILEAHIEELPAIGDSIKGIVLA
jgi:hypothetical protein